MIRATNFLTQKRKIFMFYFTNVDYILTFNFSAFATAK